VRLVHRHVDATREAGSCGRRGKISIRRKGREEREKAEKGDGRGCFAENASRFF
jgi:hypothetical protein